MQRRRFIQALTGLTTSISTTLLLLGCNMNKKNIKTFGKTFIYLNDPDLREKETSDAMLIVKEALFSGVAFQGQNWRNVKFVDCDFAGGYEIKLNSMENCVFERCKIVGIHEFGDMRDVRFFQCLSGGNSVWGGQADSRSVTFEECQFIGDSSDQNHQGGIGTYGEATFINCKIKWFAVVGYKKLVLQNCECESVRTSLNSEDSGAVVLIERSKLRGTFDMVPASLQSLTIRDTVIDNLDLSNASIKGDVLIERVRADKMNLAVASGRAITLKSVQVNGAGSKVFYLAANRFATVLLDDCTLPSHPGDEKAWIGGAEKEPAYNTQPPLSQSVTLRASKLPELDLSYLNTRQLRIEGTSIERADVSNARIGLLEFDDAAFTFTLNLSGTQVKEFKQSGGTDLRKLGGLKIDGSNIKLPR